MFSSVLFRLKFHCKEIFFCIHIKWNNKQPLIISRNKQNNEFRLQTNEMHTTRHRHPHIYPKRYRDFRYTIKSMNDVSTSSYDIYTVVPFVFAARSSWDWTRAFVLLTRIQCTSRRRTHKNSDSNINGKNKNVVKTTNIFIIIILNKYSHCISTYIRNVIEKIKISKY